MKFLLTTCARLCLLLSLALPIQNASATIAVQIGQNFTGTTVDQSGFEPADANGAIGPNHYVEFVNGRFTIYSKTTGALVQSRTDLNFWKGYGVTLGATFGVTDPRTIYDAAAQRWFTCMVDINNSNPDAGNRFLIAVSTSADPTAAWHAFAFTADPLHGYFADFPTMGIDADGVYLSGDLFDSSGSAVGPILVSMPKSDLLASTPTVANRSFFNSLSASSRGHILQPAATTGAAATSEIILAVGDLGLDFQSHTTLDISYITNAASGGSATLSSAFTLTVPAYSIPFNPTQPNGMQNLDDGDTRFGACARRVGDILYAAHSVQAGSHAAIRWYRINAINHTLLQSGTITNATLDLFYPSIAANDAGIVVIGCNGCSSSSFVSSYAVAGETVNGTLSFGNLTLLKSGTASYNTGSPSRWGDYSTTTVDPSDSNRFWTVQMYASGASSWSTQITELIIEPVELTIAASNPNIKVSWPAAASGFRLQYTTSLNPTINWQSVAQTPVTNSNQISVTLPNSGNQFFRLINP